jgi:ABC-type sugar transport system ATPase subunit
MAVPGPKALIFDEPTRGIDVGAKAEIYELLGNLAAASNGILVVSSDLPEIDGDLPSDPGSLERADYRRGAARRVR